VSERPESLNEDEREALLATIRELMEHSRAGSLDADDEENEAYLRAVSALARYTPAT
jgi:hypothetical protein